MTYIRNDNDVICIKQMCRQQNKTARHTTARINVRQPRLLCIDRSR